ncbi:hypothetical protein N665_0002s0063 [Sinapis alba]|nr:hypothetical protein N665_0002s0063 [Sinapis alba]
MDMIETQHISAMTIEKVVIHPLVLRNIVNNHNRLAKDSGKRVVGVLLGSSSRGIVGVTNSYAVPFEEDEKDPSIWSFDHNHHESMFLMFKGINAKEVVVGWYSTCPKLRENDLDVNALFSGYVSNPVLVTIDVAPQEHAIPTKAYYAVKEAFVHVPTEIAAPEVNEIGTSKKSILVTQMTPGGDNGVVDMIECLYMYAKNSVRISVEGYDLSLNPVDLDISLVKHFESCGAVDDVEVPINPETNAICGRFTTVVLRGEGAAEKALALNGSDVGGWRVSVKILPPELPEMSSRMSGREFALPYVAENQNQNQP